MVKRIFVEKKNGFDIEAKHLLKDIITTLGIDLIDKLKVVNRYDIEGLSCEEYSKVKGLVFKEEPVDVSFDEEFKFSENDRVIAYEFLPGQYDQTADSASQCIQIITLKQAPKVKSAKIIIMNGNISDEEFLKIKDYIINPIECREASLNKPGNLDDELGVVKDVKIVEGFIKMSEDEIKNFHKENGFAMTIDDVKHCQKYFRESEERNPTITEMKVLDTYWSDHCRHTTFLTKIDEVKYEKSSFKNIIDEAFNIYKQSRKFVYENKEKDICLMDIATIGMKELRKKGIINDLDISDEINAASIVVNVDVDGKDEEWLVMFKNETHNHPTEIEPVGGAATCLGGAIRDPLSGRVYVYQAMRVTGSGDPTVPIEQTLEGKLPQKKITLGAATGYSSYGNQIGLATGQVSEIYDNDYIAKRMEIGAVIGAAPKRNIIREKPTSEDVVVLLGGRTGRDGCGGATGSSKEHDEDSLAKCGAEVQKGNPPTERKIQRLFRNPNVSRLIKKCNDFGAGGVCVAIGELSDGVDINLDKVPKKYDGLDGTELAISESQERMAVVINKNDVEKFINESNKENLEATVVASITDDKRLKMTWRDKVIVDISRNFLDTNGIKQTIEIEVTDLDEACFFEKEFFKGDFKSKLNEMISNLNVCSQKGLIERFDSTIGANSILMPFGGKYQLTPEDGMASKIPVLDGETNTATLMTYGFDPKISKWSPFHGAVFAILDSVAKSVAMGGDYSKVRLTLQEYFERLGKDSKKWGKPFSALLGAYYAQHKLNIPAIGGKDSMSGTFKDISVPPTLVSFAVSPVKADNVISSEFKYSGNHVALIKIALNNEYLPDFEVVKKTYSKINKLIESKKIISAKSIRFGGIAEAVAKMCFGNMLGFEFDNKLTEDLIFKAMYGSIIVEINKNEDIDVLLSELNYFKVGTIKDNKYIDGFNQRVDLKEILNKWEEKLESVFPVKSLFSDNPKLTLFQNKNKVRSNIKIAKPRVFIPVFPGSNCEYDTKKAFEKAGAHAEIFVVRNQSQQDIEESIKAMAKSISNSNIIAIPGGFSGGDEPDGAGKFISAAFRNPYVKEEITNLLKNRDGLILGVCNGFQALIKLGLVQFGEIVDLKDDYPTLTFNNIGRHASCIVKTKITSNLSPWFYDVSVGDIHSIAVSHGEGRFVANSEWIDKLTQSGQISTQYVDFEGNPSNDIRFNPNGSVNAIEGITSPCGRVLGKMAHSERIGSNVCINVPGEKNQKIFESGVKYFL